MLKTRALAAAVGLAVIVTAAATGMSLRGETRELSIAETCAHEIWPMIPARCLINAPQRLVRMVSVDRAKLNLMAERFAAAFE